MASGTRATAIIRVGLANVARCCELSVMAPQPLDTARRIRSDDVVGDEFGGANPERVQSSGEAGNQWKWRRAGAYVACVALLALVPVFFGRVGLVALLGTVGAYASGRCVLLLLKRGRTFQEAEPGQYPRLALRFLVSVVVPLLALAVAGLYLQTRTGFPWLWTNPVLAVGLALVFLWRTQILAAKGGQRCEGCCE